MNPASGIPVWSHRRKRQLRLALLALFAAVANHMPAERGLAEESPEAAVAAVEQRRIDALVSKDIDTLTTIIDDSATLVESSGTRRTKAEWLEDISSRGVTFQTFRIDENSIRVFGDIAVASGTYHTIPRTDVGPAPVRRARHLRVYRKINGAWKLIAHQATEIRSLHN